MKTLPESLAAVATGAVLLAGCGGAPSPVNSAEVPAATEAKPSQGGFTESKPAGAPSAAPTATPAAPHR